MHVFEESQWENLARRLDAHLRNALPAEHARLGDSAVRSLATSAIQRGRGFGMVSELDFFRLFNLFFLMGPGMQDEPWALEILSHPNMTAGTKLPLLEQECRDRGKWE